MEGFVTLLFIKVEGQNLTDLDRLEYFDMYFSKIYLFLELKASMTSLLRHNWCILERPCNFAIFMEEAQNFVSFIILMCFLRKRH